MKNGIAFRHLAFTGYDVNPACLDFEDGLNILYGASNTGKSFVFKALDFMLGSSKGIPSIQQRLKYNAVWLGLELPDGEEITLYRAITGGAYKVYKNLIISIPEEKENYFQLEPKHDSNKTNTLSAYLLNLIGLNNKVVVKNASGEKESITFRTMSPYFLVSEETIISERSPILVSGQHTKETAEKNIFRTLLTGLDNAAVVPTVNAKTFRAVRDGKIELIDEWIKQISAELDESSQSFTELETQEQKLNEFLSSLQKNLYKHQEKIDHLIIYRRNLVDKQDILQANLNELEITLGRFNALNEAYSSDIERLEAIAESGFVLSSLGLRNCLVCGAPPEAQIHKNDTLDLSNFYKAASSEIDKIRREQRELQKTQISLTAEAEGLRRILGENNNELESIRAQLDSERPLEVPIRQQYEQLSLRIAEIKRKLELKMRLEKLERQRTQLITKKSKRVKNEKLEIGIDGQHAFEFSKTVKEVLEAWNFPQASNISFNPETQDIQISGKDRSANGKGVRALLHSAFKIAILIFCRKNNLPHPGFIVLDTPLLTYREPIANMTFEELDDDEIAIKKSNVALHFYKHLASLKEIGQILIIENSDIPDSIRKIAKVHTFTGQKENGRFGFF